MKRTCARSDQKCVDKGYYNGVKQSAYTAGNLADSCEKKCNGTTNSAVASQLGDSNQYVKNMCKLQSTLLPNCLNQITKLLT